MIIFGWNFQTIKQIGFVFKKVCEHCNNEEYWVLTRTITWFTLFFIPVIPYSFKFFLKKRRSYKAKTKIIKTHVA